MTEILDSQGNTITVGARVLDDQTGGGTVLAIDDADGDMNVYGRMVSIPPSVLVEYDDGEKIVHTAFWNATGPWDDHRDDYTCDDLTVALDLKYASPPCQPYREATDDQIDRSFDAYR